MSLAWKKHRMRCVDPGCAKKSWVLEDHRIAAKNCLLRPGRPSGPPSKSAGAARSQKWLLNSRVTGTRSTMR
jgi:hypothetical protein